MKKNCKAGKFIAGTALGIGLGVLFAPKAGKDTRKDINKKIKELIEEAKKIDLEDVKEAITKKAKEIEKELEDLDKEKVLKIAKKKAEEIQKKANELYNLAIKKGTPILEKTTREIKQKTADALKKVVNKLEAK